MSFSLPLTKFEQFILYDDRPQFPWHIFIRLQLDAEVDRDHALAAAEFALGRHPLIGATIEEKKRTPHWRPATAEQLEIEWQIVGAPEGEFPEMPYLDLRKEIGFRVYESVSEGVSTIYFQFHHACTDGKGALQFVEDWLLRYGRLCGDEVPEPAELDESLLARRNSYGRGFWRRVCMIPAQSTALIGAIEFAMHHPKPIMPSPMVEEPSGATEKFPAVLTHRFEHSELDALRAAAKECGATLNDLLIRDAHFALQRWRDSLGVNEHDSKAPRRWMRLMVPMSLRSDFENKMPAANVVGAVFIDRRGTDCVDRKKALDGVRRQMGIIKRLELGFAFLWSLRLQVLVPGGLKKMTQGENCLNSAVLTNLGPIFRNSPLLSDGGIVRSGNVCVQSVDVLAPIRPKNYVSFSIGAYAGRLSLSMHYDSRMISPERAALLLEKFVASIRESIDTPQDESV